MTEIYCLTPAVFSAIAAGLAAWATWRAPLAAAQLADALRREADERQERRRQKLFVFTTLMQERVAIYSESGVRGTQCR